MRRDRLDRAVERVVAGAALEGLGVELRVQQPVGDGLVVADQPARAAQQVALEVVGLGGLPLASSRALVTTPAESKCR